MKYIVCEEPGKFKSATKPQPIRKEGEALLKIKRIGICGTDLHAYAGNQAFFTYPRILGHELAAEIIEIDEHNPDFEKGDKVVIMPYISCGNCVACKNGKTNCCTNIKVLGVHTDGGMQEIISISTNLLIKANHLSYEEMAVVEPLAIGAHAIRRAQLKKNEIIAVIGCGPIGIGIMKLAQLQGARVIAIDVNEERLQYAKEKIGVDYTVLAGEDAVSTMQKITQNDLASVVFDATGNKYALENGPDFMSHGGRYVLVGLSKGELCFSHPAIHAKESSILCSRNATLEDFELVIRELPNFPTDSFISHKVNFDELTGQFNTWIRPDSGVIKAMVSLS